MKEYLKELFIYWVKGIGILLLGILASFAFAGLFVLVIKILSGAMH